MKRILPLLFALLLAAPAWSQHGTTCETTFGNEATDCFVNAATDSWVVITDCNNDTCSAGSGSAVVLHQCRAGSCDPVVHVGSGIVGLKADIITEAEIADNAVEESHLDADNSTTDEFCLTWEDTGSRFSWQSCGGGGAVPVREICFDAASLQPIEDNFPPLEEDEGTNQDILYRAFSSTTEECASGKLSVPADLVAGNATYKIYWKTPTATSGNVCWELDHAPIATSTDWDASASTDTLGGALATDGVANDLTIDTGTIDTLANLGWDTADDLVLFQVCRNPTCTSDVTEDAHLLMFCIGIPRA